MRPIVYRSPATHSILCQVTLTEARMGVPVGVKGNFTYSHENLVDNPVRI